MCGRFNLRLSGKELREFFDLFREPVVTPRYNIAPTQQILTIHIAEQGRREGIFRHWGLIPSWARTAAEAAKMMNARSETVAEKPAFRTAVRQRRCLIPASGFYEWQQLPSKKKQPWHIVSASGEPLAFAGIWERWRSPDDVEIESCSILTTAANDFMEPLHDRMPVLIPRGLFGAWLDPEITDPARLRPLLAPPPEDALLRTPVGPLVNSVRNDSPSCIEPVAEQRSLFEEL